jgi:hypothetical protein
MHTSLGTLGYILRDALRLQRFQQRSTRHVLHSSRRRLAMAEGCLRRADNSTPVVS